MYVGRLFVCFSCVAMATAVGRTVARVPSASKKSPAGNNSRDWPKQKKGKKPRDKVPIEDVIRHPLVVISFFFPPNGCHGTFLNE